MKSVMKYVVFHLKIRKKWTNHKQVNIMKTMKKCQSYFTIKSF